jgi:hypothetical protein
MSKIEKVYLEIKDLHSKESVPPLTDKAISSLKGMKTILKNRGEQFFNDLDDGEVDGDYIVSMEERINEVTSSLLELSAEELIKYFNSIQLWGGRTGRSIYIYDGGIKRNLDITEYRKLIEACRFSKFPEDVFKATQRFNEKTKNLGYAFITKHVRFLTLKNDFGIELPIYDREFAVGVYGKKSVIEKDVLSYWLEMIACSQKYEISMRSLERQLFNYLRG